MEDKVLKKLVKNAKKGDLGSFNKLFSLKWNVVYFTALKILHDEQNAADAAQNAFVTVFEKLHTLKEDELFDAWMNRIVITSCHLFIRKEQRYADNADIEDYRELLIEDKKEFLPEECWKIEENRELVSEAVDSLPQAQRETILMYYFQDMSIVEIAEITNNKIPTIKSRLQRARDAIGEYLTVRGKKGKEVKVIAMLPIPILTRILVDASQKCSALPAKEIVWNNIVNTMNLPAEMMTLEPSNSNQTNIIKPANAVFKGFVISAGATAMIAAIALGIYLFAQNSADAPVVVPTTPPVSTQVTVSTFATTVPTPTFRPDPPSVDFETNSISETSHPSATEDGLEIYQRDNIEVWLCEYKKETTDRRRAEFQEFLNQNHFKLVSKFDLEHPDTGDTDHYILFELMLDDGEAVTICELKQDSGNYGIAYTFSPEKIQMDEMYPGQWYIEHR